MGEQGVGDEQGHVVPNGHDDRIGCSSIEREGAAAHCDHDVPTVTFVPHVVDLAPDDVPTELADRSVEKIVCQRLLCLLFSSRRSMA